MGGTSVKLDAGGSEGDHGDVSPKLEDAGNVNCSPGKAGSTTAVSAPSNSDPASTSPISGKSL